MYTSSYIQNKKLKKYSKAALLSGSALMLTGCLNIDAEPLPAYIGTLDAETIDGYSSTTSSTVTYSNSSAAVMVDLSKGTGKGGFAEGDTLLNIDYLIGSDYDDTLTGNELDNRIIGGKGADEIDGKDGIDVVEYYENGNGTAVDVNLMTGVGKGGNAEGDTYLNIENIQGTLEKDILTGNDQDNSIYGSGGGDTIYGMGGNDSLAGAGDNGRIYGGDGNDMIDGKKGSELYGENGDDVFSVHYDAMVSGGAGKDTIKYFNRHIVKIDILKADHKISLTLAPNENGGVFVNTIDSIEEYTHHDSYTDRTITTNIKDIWSDLASTEQAKFIDEAEFLNWLGNDAGYNYEGL